MQKWTYPRILVCPGQFPLFFLFLTVSRVENVWMKIRGTCQGPDNFLKSLHGSQTIWVLKPHGFLYHNGQKNHKGSKSTRVAKNYDIQIKMVEKSRSSDILWYVTLPRPKEGLKVTLSLLLGPKTTRVTMNGKSTLAVLWILIDIEFGSSGCGDQSFTLQQCCCKPHGGGW